MTSHQLAWRRRSWRSIPIELLLVGVGAVPGALLRWGLQADPLANLLGCVLIGVVGGLEPPRPRLFLLLGVGFCGALTTFGGWVLALATALGQGAWTSLALLLLELVTGVAAVAAGRGLARGAGRTARDFRR
jgi:CrcB protein